MPPPRLVKCHTRLLLLVIVNVSSGPAGVGVVGADVVDVVVAAFEVAVVELVTEATSLVIIPGFRGTGGNILSTNGDNRNSSAMATTSIVRDLRSMIKPLTFWNLELEN